MRPPVKKLIDSETAAAPVDSRTADSRTEALQEKARLAEHLHAQGVNPTRWTEAHPAPQSDQATYQATGLKPKGNQFDVDGKLYDWSPAVTATPEQAKAIANAYIAERTGKDDAVVPAPKIEELLDITKVPLKHPLGTPHNERPADDMSAAEERTALIQHYAQSDVDPAKAHLGDPVLMKDQERLKAEIEKTLPGDKSEISGLPGFYQGFDDGWIYRTNEYTRASTDLTATRSEDTSANENDALQQIDGAATNTTHPQPHSSYPRLLSGIEKTREEYQSAVRGLSETSRLMDDLKGGKPLTDRQMALKERITANLQRAGIKFDYQAVDADLLRTMAAGEEKFSRSLDRSDIEKLPAIMSALGVQVSEALAGGNFNAVRLQQAGSVWERLALIPELYASLPRLTAAKAVVTPLSIEAAKDGPIDYDAVMNETRDILVDIGLVEPQKAAATLDQMIVSEVAQKSKELQPPSKETIGSLKSGLGDASNIEIIIGGVPLFKQSEHKTLMDEIFRTEFIKIAQEKGCLPGPDDDREWDSHGGSKSQKRITDVDQTGHLGSRQADGWLRWENIDKSWTEILWNSTSTLVDGFTDIAREVIALKDLIVKADRQLAMGAESVKRLSSRTDYPVRGKATAVSMGTKPNWSEAELREYISKKLRDFFDKNFEDCKFVGEFRTQKLDFPDDPDLPPTPPR